MASKCAAAGSTGGFVAGVTWYWLVSAPGHICKTPRIVLRLISHRCSQSQNWSGNHLAQPPNSTALRCSSIKSFVQRDGGRSATDQLWSHWTSSRCCHHCFQWSASEGCLVPAGMNRYTWFNVRRHNRTKNDNESRRHA